jgi:hypothetical protein
MENAVKLETEEEFREAIGVLAAEVVRLKEVLEAQGELVRAMDARITTLTTLVDIQQATLEGRRAKLAGSKRGGGFDA